MENKQKRHTIESAKCGENDGGLACGPCSGSTVAEVEVSTEDGNIFFISLVEASGFPNCFLTEQSYFDRLTDPEFYDEEFFGTKSLDVRDYDDIYQNTGSEYHQILKYLAYLVRSYGHDEETFIRYTVGKSMEDIDIPMTDIESEKNYGK